MTSTPVALQTPKITPVMFIPADSANTLKTVHAAANTGSKVVAVIGSTTDAANSKVAQLFLTRASSSFLLGSTVVSSNAGNDGSNYTVNLLNSISGLPRDNDGQTYLFLQSGDLLQASMTSQVSSGKIAHFTGIGADF